MKRPPRTLTITYKGFIAAHNDGLIDARPVVTLTAKGREAIDHRPTDKKEEVMDMHFDKREDGTIVLIVDTGATKECASCGMDDSMESGLNLCPDCLSCLHWEDEFGAGSCCTCKKEVTS